MRSHVIYKRFGRHRCTVREIRSCSQSGLGRNLRQPSTMNWGITQLWQCQRRLLTGKMHECTTSVDSRRNVILHSKYIATLKPYGKSGVYSGGYNGQELALSALQSVCPRGMRGSLCIRLPSSPGSFALWLATRPAPPCAQCPFPCHWQSVPLPPCLQLWQQSLVRVPEKFYEGRVAGTSCRWRCRPEVWWHGSAQWAAM